MSLDQFILDRNSISKICENVFIKNNLGQHIFLRYCSVWVRSGHRNFHINNNLNNDLYNQPKLSLTVPKIQ